MIYIVIPQYYFVT